MDSTLAQILNKLYELQLENQNLQAEHEQLKKALVPQDLRVVQET